MVDEMKFGLLGPMIVRRGGTAIRVPEGMQRVFLALLLLRANHCVSVRDLAKAQWGEPWPESAESNMPSYIRRLRTTLKDTDKSRIVRCPSGYMIKVHDGELDVARFEALVKAARAATGAGSWGDARARAGAALTLWRGELLADVDLPSVTRGERTRLEELRLEVLEVRLGADLELGHGASIIAELQTLTQAHPLRQRFQAQLMLALYGSGRRPEALTVYPRAHEMIVEKTGEGPDRFLSELHARMLRADPALDTPRPARPRPRKPERVPLGGTGGPAAEPGPAGHRASPGASSARPRRRLAWVTAAVVVIVIVTVLTVRALSAGNPQVYSQPQFCYKSDAGFFCLNAAHGNPSSGTDVQTWAHSAGYANNMFLALQIGTVTGTWPFRDQALDREQRAFYQVLELEADPGGHPSGQCLSTADASKQDGADGSYYFPVTFRPCDQTMDRYSTWLTWNSYGPVGNPITMVELTNKTGSPQQFACLDPRNVLYHCVAGSQIATVSAGQNWAHFK